MRYNADESRYFIDSINAIPLTVLPDGELRRQLLREAQSGDEVYAYHPAATDHWNVWRDNQRFQITADGQQLERI